MVEFKKEKLGDIARLEYGYGVSASIEEVGPKYLRISDITSNLINRDEVPYCQISEEDYEKYKLCRGDIVIARTGATAGYAKLIRDPHNSVFAGYLIRARVNKDIASPGFVGKIIESNMFKKFIERNKGGAAQPHANVPVIREFFVSLPPLPTQKRIASILSIYDDLIENNARRIKILEEKTKIIYKEWFVRFKFPGSEKIKMVDSGTDFGEIPEGWEVERIGDIFTTILGGTPSREINEYWGGTIPRLNSGKTNELLILKESEFITEEGYKKSSTKLMPKRTTVIAITGATLGQVSILGIEACANQSVVGIYDENKIFNNYIYEFFINNIKSVINNAGGGAQQHINKDIVNDTKIIIPDNIVVNKFNGIADGIFEEMLNLFKQNQNLKKTRDILIPKLVSGEIEV